MGILQIFTLLGAMGMFLYGMNLMSSGLQKAAGDRLRGFLSAMTSNPFKRVLTGVGITALIQSSSATTVMVVSFVNAGLLTLVQAIGVIMGANIGTTITAWMVSLLGFKADISILAVPLMLLGYGFNSNWDVLYLDESRVKIIAIPLIIDIIGYLLMTIPYIFWDYDNEKQSKVMQVLQRRAEVTEKNAKEQGETVSGGFVG